VLNDKSARKSFASKPAFLAKQAAGSCLVQYGENRGALCRGDRRATTRHRLLSSLLRLPAKRQAAAGKFPGGFLKREGRPTTKETLTARLMDRPIRPLWPTGFNDEVQIQSFVMSSDRQMDGDVLAMNGAAGALGVSALPFQGPLGSVRLGLINGEFYPLPDAR